MEGLGRLKVRLGKGLEGLGRLKVCVGKGLEGLCRAKVRLGKGLEGLGKPKEPDQLIRGFAVVVSRNFENPQNPLG